MTKSPNFVLFVSFVVKNSFPFGYVRAALGYLSLCGESFRLFEANGYVEE